jgi:lipopolysaccharide/colanic/teichoic acid biosynthesis glycosyltransferase
MLMQPQRMRQSWLQSWNRLRVQLGGALIFAVGVPALLLATFSPDSFVSGAHAQNIVVTAGSAMLSVYLLRNITLFPGIRTGYFVLPAVLIGYGIFFSMLLFLRLEYSRAMLLVSLVSIIGWLHLANFLGARARSTRIAIVPLGDVTGLREIDAIEWVILPGPVHHEGAYDALVADFRHDMPPEWEAYLADCALRGLAVFHVKQLRESLTGRVEIEHLSENSFGSLIPFAAYLTVRRVLDRVTAAVALVLLVPLFLFIAVAIKLDTPGPVFFRQRRVGYRGAIFTVLKFRTMVDKRTEGDELTGAITRDNDPRITRVGGLLRRTRVDELPQVFNILRGEMSWIGPRPEADVLSEWYRSELPFYRYRHIVPPGLTGWAQVNQGHVAHLDQVTLKLHYDFYYIKNFSPWLDALIVAKTIETVFSGFGAR